MVLETIRRVYPKLTKSQKRLADFIATSYHQAAFMTASRLAKHLDINEATVIRFAQRLGYSGYPELVSSIRGVLQQELAAQGQVRATAEEPLLTALGIEVEHLSRVASHVSPEAARDLLALLRGARRIVVTGEGVSYHLAGAVALALAGVGLQAQAVAGDPESLALAVAALCAGDVLLVIAVSDGSVQLAEAIHLARERGARSVALACSPIAGAAQAADVALSCAPSPLFPVPSMAAIAALADALAQALARQDLVTAQRFSERVQDIGARLRAV